MPNEDRELVAHLLRRAGFSSNHSDIDSALNIGYEKTVENLLTATTNENTYEDLLDRFHSEHCDEESPRWSAVKWVFRMINTKNPLEEKITLMWHGVFATGWAKVTNGPMMTGQYEMLREHGLGNFRTLLQKLSRDPAMLYWLDQQTNHADAVNENYGRELLELFSMGRGNYTEEDVRSCARAFSGWTITHILPRYPTGYWPSEFVYNSDDHDDNEKTFLGETGNFNGDDVIEIIVKQPATSRFVAKEIYKFFVADEIDDDAVDQIANVYLTNKYEIRDVLRFVFNSDFFKSARFNRVKSPIEFIVGTVQLAGQHRSPYQFGLDRLAELSSMMGQDLLNPPTVEGWHTGREWIDSAFLVERLNFATEKLSDTKSPGIIEISDRIGNEHSTITRENLLDLCASKFACVDLDDSTRTVLLQELSLDDDVKCEGAELTNAVAEVLTMISTSKEYQML